MNLIVISVRRKFDERKKYLKNDSANKEIRGHKEL